VKVEGVWPPRRSINMAVCFMFELFFAVELEPSKNITNNPTCEWQLRLDSKRNTSNSS
jgi:hypothetical protein